MQNLGAEVIKIEAPDRPATRGGRYPGGDPFRYHYNRSGYFNKFNRNKYAITLDLRDADCRAMFLRLVAESDVVLENNSPRVMRNFDLEYPALREANPEIIMVSISGFGQTGPDRDYVAYGANVEASSGLAAVTGYPDDDRPYRSTLFYADPVTGGHAAIATLAALHSRAVSGRGQYVDMSLHENGITFFPEAVIEYTVTGNLAQRRGNRNSRFAPQGCYPSFGDDSWIAICIRSGDEWSALAVVIGRPDLAADPELGTVAGRQSRHDELDAAISEWTSQYDHNEAARLLQGAGVPRGSCSGQLGTGQQSPLPRPAVLRADRTSRNGGVPVTGHALGSCQRLREWCDRPRRCSESTTGWCCKVCSGCQTGNWLRSTSAAPSPTNRLRISARRSGRQR